MIPIPYEHAFTAYLTAWLAVIALLWLYEEIRIRKTADWTVDKNRLYLCDKCRLSFLAKDDHENITRCPRCNEMCFIRKRKRF